MIFFMNMQPNQPSDSLLSKTQVIKPHNLKYYLKHILFNKITLLILIIIVIGGFILINNNLTPPTSQVKDGNLRITNVIYTPTPTEIIDIDSADDSDLGLAGYSSGTLISDNQAIQITLLAPDRKEVILNSFPCEESREVTAVRGTYRILALASLQGPVIDKYILGERDFVMDPPDIEQTGLFSKLVTLSNNPTYQAFTLAFRKSCYDTEIYFFGFNDKTQKVIQIPFVKKDGSLSESIFVPKGFGIPQIDSFGNTISSSYNYETGWRDKSKYKFNPEKFQFEEIESYTQPN